ncbi:S1 family peptidase [Thiohalophilus thiocyanatoxydans]|uniref:Trypsin-like peptidase n=1 Tax=Thiohalophilus thiocyanatoxydans TaxID=381308 RepID=A0A4R8IRZ0_9GAMM|nr:serine protease [Thiohalophilus thiocyanatoxydans]TDY03801.1 trypsin-like peptidase [Thiohalophilus thiocyanatoxydans]
MKTESRTRSISTGIIALWLGAAACWFAVPAWSAGLPDVIERIKPSVVGVGTYQETRQPRARLLATGFVVGDGRHVITNDHVLPAELDSKNKELLAVFIPGDDRRSQVRPSQVVARDPDRDLVLLHIDGEPLSPLVMGDSEQVREGQAIVFTGFPIGAALGLIPATHRGMVSAIAPVAIPVRNVNELDPALIRRMRDPYPVFQLDATAYPGNSGSPLYHPVTGKVLAVLNMVYVKEGRESALERPSGISYAIPVRYVRALLREQGLE